MSTRLKGKQLDRFSIPQNRLDLNQYTVGDSIEGIDPNKVLVNKEYVDQEVTNLEKTIEVDWVFSFDSTLDTISSAIMLKGPRDFDSIDTSANLSSVTFETKTINTSTWTTSSDITALTNWINTNITTASTLWQLRLVATYSGTGEAQALLIETKTY